MTKKKVLEDDDLHEAGLPMPSEGVPVNLAVLAPLRKSGKVVALRADNDQTQSSTSDEVAAPPPANEPPLNTPPPPRPFARGDHVEIAQRLVTKFCARAAFLHADGKFYLYNIAQGIFVPVDKADLSCAVQDFAGLDVV